MLNHPLWLKYWNRDRKRLRSFLPSHIHALKWVWPPSLKEMAFTTTATFWDGLIALTHAFYVMICISWKFVMQWGVLCILVALQCKAIYGSKTLNRFSSVTKYKSMTRHMICNVSFLQIQQPKRSSTEEMWQHRSISIWFEWFWTQLEQ